MKKVLIVFMIVIGIIVLLIGICIGGMAFIASSNNRYKGDYKATLPSSSASAPKALVVYQPSMKKTAANIADQIAKGLQDSGYEVTVSYPGKHLSPDVKDYKVVVFGSPVIMGKPSAALTDYISGLQNAADKKTAVFSVGSLDEAPELDIVEKSFKAAAINKKTKFKGTDKTSLDTAYEFGLDLGKE
ncbi:MAG: hypothetical protein K0R50_4929 [Eubacterium sp.]|jgi:flavorubredoxin|nr:hypothetical protein [Eubacterium sp.]